MALPENPRVVALIVPRTLVKAAKTAVAEAGWWGRGRIEPLAGLGDDPAFTLPTTLPHAADSADSADSALRALGLTAYVGAIRVVSADAAPARTNAPNALTAAITAFLRAHAAPSSIPALLASAPRRWSLYPPLALLPANAFSIVPWPAFLSALSPAFLARFHRSLAHALSATHLAINAPIPSTSTLRLPHLTPLHGEFTTLWSTVTQNQIHQTWAPLHTMFSRGNITEKARVLGFPDVRGAHIADLYAGIGYFAFSYVAAGAARVWCWELSPWSVEALRRGAGMNGWGVVVVGAGEPVGEVADEVRLVVFCEDCAAAGERLRGRGKVRHVNLGLLPTSRGGWGTALEVVADGGWVHVHENVGEGEVDGCAGVVEEGLRELEGRGREVVAVGVERVKTFAPGVVHCVVDVRIG
ncbi:S-adenosylmethionine-dependent methyltransferase [Maublancomyces gigas]|uniref:tRNA(Phe) (4-demethylwyosine(37)-C(7)) aminocarboxypropyltransferase n=1 Tax=Discina gigas TaxID=1032678 RepID=A0ABR3GEB0_9PEZI